MFNKKTCGKCGNKVNKRHDFCHSCGNRMNSKENKSDWGMIGKNDFEEKSNAQIPNMFGGISGKIINKMIKSTMKMLEKEMQNNANNLGQTPQIGTNFELYVNGKRISPDKIKVTNMSPKKVQKTEPKNLKNKFFSAEKTQKFLELPKSEPQTNLRRLSDKIIYEISIPGVKSIEDISIVKLEKSIEIKAFSGNKAYSKIIPFDLNVTDYDLSEEKLILELSD